MVVKTLKWLDEYLEIGICVVLMVVMTLLIFVQVIMRYVFSNSLTWSEELARYVFIWLIYLGISYAAKQMKHVKIQAALYLFPRRLRPYITIIGDIVMFLFSLFVIWYGAGMVAFQGMFRAAALGIPMSWIYAAPVVGFALTTIRQIQTVVYRIRRIRAGCEEEAAQ